MAVPQVDNHPAYIIYRDVPDGEPYDATSPLSFFPPKGSDELFDALRLSFPLLKTHSERMRDAIIQFLLEERQVELFGMSPATTMESSQLTWPSVSSGSTSNFSSPELLNFATPTSFGNSPQIQETPQTSTATSNQSSPPSLDQMTGVFSLTSDPQPKQRVRRKMTDAEKIEYRKRRIVKACDKCAKRKRKCPHNQAEMKTVSTPTISTKSNSPQPSVSTQPPMLLPNPHASQTFDGSYDPASFGNFGDFNMFDDPLPDVSVDDFFHFERFEDSPTLFNNVNDVTQDPFVPAQLMRQNNAITQGARHSGSQLGIPSKEGIADMFAEFPTFSSSDHPQGLPRSQFQAQPHPSQRAVRDPRTDGLLSETRISSTVAEEQSDQTSNAFGSLSVALRAKRDRPSPATSDHSSATPLSEPPSAFDMNLRQPRLTGSHGHQEVATTSTSVSTLNESPAPRSAALQGRPQSERLTNWSVETGQTVESSEDSRRQVSLGEGIRSSGSLSTELYMLRRRLPAMRRPTMQENHDDVANVAAQKLTANSRGQQSPEQLSVQANGGLGSQVPDTVREKAGVLQVRDRAQHAARQTTDYVVAGVTAVSSGQNMAPTLVGPSSAGLLSQDRMSDHMRYRDHHVRPDGNVFYQLALTLGAFALLTMFSPTISALCLALWLTTQSSKEVGNPEGIDKCTSKNSSWLSTFVQRRNSRSDVEFRVLKTRQYIRGGGNTAGISLFEAGPDAWFCGLMSPFRLSPVLTCG